MASKLLATPSAATYTPRRGRREALVAPRAVGTFAELRLIKAGVCISVCVCVCARECWKMIYDISAGRQKGGAAPAGRGNAPSLHLALSHIYENISEHIKSVRKFPQCCKSRENSRCQSCHGQARVARWAGSWESWERCLTGDKTQHVKCPLIVACNLLQWQSLVVQIRDNPGRTGNMAAKCNASEHAHTLIRLARLPISLWLQWVQPMHSNCKYTANILHIYYIYTAYM